MMKRFFYHSILSLFLLVMFCITGGGNLAKAQSYQLVKSTEGLVSGDKYLIVSVSKDYSKALGTQNTNNRAAVDVTFTDGNISSVPSGACELVLQKQDDGTWAFYDESNGGYLYAASKSDNHLKTQTTLDANGKADITITDGVANIQFQGANTHNWLRYNSTSTLFSCYSSGQKDVYLYHYVVPTGTTDPNISYSTSSLTIAANGTLTQPTLNNPYGVTINYSSSNPSVATVTDKGVIALAGRTGTAKITATSQANATYKEGTATYTLTVFGAPEITPESGKYAKSVDVAISATDAAALWYTTDGSEPTTDNAAATKVTEFPVNLKLGLGEHTVKAITAYDAEGTILSNVETRTYNVLDYTTVVKESPFAATSGDLDDVISYTTAQENGTAEPKIYNNHILLYQPGKNKQHGGSITISAKEGYEIKSVTIGTAQATSYSYTLDGSTVHSANTPLAKNAKATLGGLSNQSVTFYCEGASSSNRLEVYYISVSYVLKAGAVVTPSITFSETETWGAPIDATITATGASSIWYTTDGTDPTADGATPIKKEGESTSFKLSETGEYTIKAIALNDNGDYSQVATATCVINKPTPGLAKMKYKKVTSNDDIVDGGVYIIVCETKKVALESIDTSGTKGVKTDVELVENTYSGAVNESSTPYEIQLNKIDENKYSIYFIGQEKYLSVVTKDDNKITLNPGVNNDFARWSISCTDGNAIIGCIGSTGYNIQYNPSGSMFRMYDSAQTPIQLYKKTFDLSVNANTAGYATAYTTFPYVMPASADGYIVTETAEGATIKAKNKYPAGKEVPAYAPLLIKNAEAGVTLNPVVLGKTVEAYPYADENLLHGTRLESDGVTTDVDGTNNYYYYKLSYKLEAGNPVADSYGFYRGKADGSAFVMKNTLTAYLALPKSSGLVNNLRINIDNEDEPATSIHANRIPADNMPQSVYTLSGVRVNAAGNRLPKGIYIVNGKKVLRQIAKSR
ncbi:MAG: chitobiase/beta-hexosaminidase C-terminal domain-containing protein [Bacteroidales bacterium]|nr:chitobiase/beta-hexosaminidase C-terminal domain-containing protein [Bacteroidales bacterium]